MLRALTHGLDDPAFSALSADRCSAGPDGKGLVSVFRGELFWGRRWLDIMMIRAARADFLLHRHAVGGNGTTTRS